MSVQVCESLAKALSSLPPERKPRIMEAGELFKNAHLGQSKVQGRVSAWERAGDTGRSSCSSPPRAPWRLAWGAGACPARSWCLTLWWGKSRIPTQRELAFPLTQNL